MRQRVLRAPPLVSPRQILTKTSRTVSSYNTLLTLFLLACVSLGASATWKLSHHFATLPVSVPCNPFAQPGSLFLDLDTPENTIWKPFDSSCPPSHLLPLVKYILESDAVDKQTALPWLANKTMVLIGDSIERFSLDYFCDLMGGELSLIERNHFWSPSDYKNGRDELRENEEIMRTWTADGRPHRCYVASLNLNLLSFFMFGVANYEEFEQQKTVFGRPHYYAPVELGSRIDHWVLGVLQKADLKADLVQFSSCLWDVMHFSEIDGAAFGSEDAVHAPFKSSERLDWYRVRLNAALDKVESAFPSSALVWRRGHYVPCGQFHVPCARNMQLTSVADHVISQRTDRWAVDETGSLIKGYTDFYKDKVHPGEAFRGLWSDSALYRLRETYYSSRR